MKKLLAFLCLFFFVKTYAQNVGIGTHNPKSKLHVAGDLRVDSLAKKDSGVVIHKNDGVLSSLRFTGKKSDVLRGDGTFQSLNAVAADAPYWSITGNSGTNPDSNFIGTTDDAPLTFRVNNMKAGQIDLWPNTNTSFGIFSGGQGMGVSSSGFGNTAIGALALEINIKGNHNTAIGYGALANDSTSSGNTAVGAQSLSSNETGKSNCAFGSGAMSNTVSGFENCAIGVGAMFGGTGRPVPGGEQNTALGARSMENNQNGNRNTAIGAGTMKGLRSGDENCAIGWQSMASIPEYGGPGALGGYQNTALGSRSMENNQIGNRNTAVGAVALNSNNTGNYNTAIGASALFSSQVGQYNTAVGTESLFKNAADNQTAIGYQSLYSNTEGKNNTSTGFKSLYYNSAGSGNVANGTEALYGNTSGSSNVAIGFRSLLTNTTGVSNTATGTRALVSNTTGVNNTGYGYGALLNNVTGFQNTGLGMYADVTAGNLRNATAIGYGAKVNASNKVRIGNAAVTKIEGQVPFSTPSDGRYKFNVREDVSGLAFILKLRPVTYQFDVSRFDNLSQDAALVAYKQASEVRRTGFIAQEVQIAAQEAKYDFSGIGIPQNAADHYSLSYESFVVPLVKAVQEQQNIILAQKAQILQLQKKSETELAQLKDELRNQQQQINLLLKEIRTISNRAQKMYTVVK